MYGKHCWKTWSVTQGAVALSSAEAEFYAMVEAVLRTKWARTVAGELGFKDTVGVVTLETDSKAAKEFVARRGLGKMRHIEIRELWLQKEVLEGKVKVVKVLGTENPADLMTKVLTKTEIEERLGRMGIDIRWSTCAPNGVAGWRKPTAQTGQGKNGSGKGAVGKERNKKKE